MTGLQIQSGMVGICRRLCLWVVLAVGLPAVACGLQEQPADAGRQPEAPDSLGAGAAGPLNGSAASRTGAPIAGNGELLLRTAAGELVPLQDLLGADYRSILADLLNRGQQQLMVPQYEVAQLELTGRIEADVVTLTADLTIRVQRDHEWVTVPVAFSDMHIDEIAHRAEAPHARAIPETSDPAQKRWHLYGAGLHTIQLKLIGRSRPQSPTGQVLSVNLPRATISHAVLEFAAPVELQKLPPDSVERVVRTEGSVTGVEFWGLTPAFSLSWVEVVAEVTRKPVIQVQSNRMKLDLNSIPVTFSGTLTLQISGSAVNELSVLFPPGLQLLEMEARNQAGASVLSSFETTAVQAGSSAVVRLSGPLEGLLTLTFDMELVNRAFPQDIQVKLPVVRDANVQSGDLDILIPPGLLVQQTRVEGAQRKRVASETDINVQATAFRLRSIESVVVLHVEEIEAQYTVSPELVFEPDADNVLLTARFPINVLTGSLLDLGVRWPGYTGSDWKLLPGTTLLGSDKQSMPLSLEPAEGDPELFQLTFPERQSGQFWVEFKAFAPIATLRSATSAISCPHVQTRQSEPIILTTIESDTYSLQPVNTESSRSLPTAPFQSSAIAEASARNRNAQAWLHSQPEVPLRFELMRQAPSVTTSMIVGLTPRDAGIEVRQEIAYQIEHSELSTLSLIVPEGVQPTVTVANEPERLRATLDTATSWSFRLPASRRGTLQVSVEYLWPVPDDDASGESLSLELPLVLPQPQTSDMRRCEVGASVSSGLRVKDEQNWSPVYSDRFEAAWLIEGPASSVPIRWQRAVSLNPISVPEFLLSRTRVLAGDVSTTTVAVFDQLPQQFRFRLPAAVRPESVSINGHALRDLGGKVYRFEDAQGIRWTITPGSVPPLSATAAATAAPDGTPVPGTAPLAGTAGTAVVLEIQTRARLQRTSQLYELAEFHRPDFELASLAIPTLWMLESRDEFRVISRKHAQTSLSGLSLRGSAAQVTLQTGVDAVLSPCTKPVQRLVREQFDEWLDVDTRQDLYFTMTDSGPLAVCLIPWMSLLLVSAVSCLLLFVVMSVLRLPSLAVPLLFVAAALPAMYLAVPEWTVLLTPFAAVGILFGIVALTFQRVATDRRLRLPGRNRTGEMLTVFGYSGILSGASSAVRSDVLVTGGSEVSIPSAR